jgi:hypothetical protein
MANTQSMPLSPELLALILTQLKSKHKLLDILSVLVSTINSSLPHIGKLYEAFECAKILVHDRHS